MIVNSERTISVSWKKDTVNFGGLLGIFVEIDLKDSRHFLQ